MHLAAAGVTDILHWPVRRAAAQLEAQRQCQQLLLPLAELEAYVLYLFPNLPMLVVHILSL